MADYNKYYQTRELFGDAYPELLDFFKKNEPKYNILDLGCGQGRDAIPLARMGYKVTGIDQSSVGIEQMISSAKAEGLNVTGIVADINEFDKYQDFNIVLLDSMLHFEKNDKKTEIILINKILKKIKKNGLICFCIQDTNDKVKILKNTINSSDSEFEILNDSSLKYKFEDKESGHTSETKYCMYIIKKNY